VLQSACRLRFSVEPLEKIWVVGETGGDRLEGDHPVNDGVARPVNYSHGPVAQLTMNFVFTQLPQARPSSDGPARLENCGYLERTQKLRPAPRVGESSQKRPKLST
jgi:hypothetical protein